MRKGAVALALAVVLQLMLGATTVALADCCFCDGDSGIFCPDPSVSPNLCGTSGPGYTCNPVLVGGVCILDGAQQPICQLPPSNSMQVPAMSGAGTAGLTLALLAGGSWYILRRRARQPTR